jgi:hypothetical protein
LARLDVAIVPPTQPIAGIDIPFTDVDKIVTRFLHANRYSPPDPVSAKASPGP